MDPSADQPNALNQSLVEQLGEQAGNTLCRSAKDITYVKSDLSLQVNPIFNKTCAKFDEYGAKGLLINQFPVEESLAIQFNLFIRQDRPPQAQPNSFDFRRFLPQQRSDFEGVYSHSIAFLEAVKGQRGTNIPFEEYQRVKKEEENFLNDYSYLEDY